MGVRLPNGAIVSIASGYQAAVAVTALSNANPAVATATNSYSAGDVVELTSGWSRATDRIFRVASPSGSAFTLEGYNSVSTAVHPAGSGIGSARKITGWTQLAQVLDSDSSGGEQRFLEFQFLESDSETRIPTSKAASGISFTIADDPTLAGYILAAEADEDRLARAVRVVLPGGSVLFYNAYISLNQTPSLKVNALMSVQATLSLLNRPVRYAS